MHGGVREPVREWRRPRPRGGHPYTGDHDLSRMQDLLRRDWARWRQGGPPPGGHPADLAWAMALFPEEREPADLIRVWPDPDGDRVLGWGWLDASGLLDFSISPEAPASVLDEILSWYEALASDAQGDGPEGLRAEAVAPPAAWAFTLDPVVTPRLSERGYEASADEHGLVHTMRRLEGDGLDSPSSVPAGYRIHAVGDHTDDLERRVEVHRAAFAPSRFTLERYLKARDSPLYRAESDVVVEAPDETFAAFCLGWYDEETGVGELEPVGTHPVHRRKGLASAACLAALLAIAALGGDTAMVYHHAGSGAGRLYRSLGFEEFGRTLRFERR